MHSRAWVAAIALITVALPCGAQRSGDTTLVFPELRSSRSVAATPALITRPFIADLQVVLVRENDVGELSPLSGAEFAAMHLTRERAFALALRNLRRRLTPFALEMPDASPEMSGLRTAEGKPLETSRLLLDDEWREAARQLGGPVVASAPVRGMLMFGRDTMTVVSRRKSLPAAQFLEVSIAVVVPYARTELLSPAVLRWTATGWQVVPPMTPADWAAMRRPDSGVPSDEPADRAVTTAPTAPAVVPKPADVTRTPKAPFVAPGKRKKP